MKKEVRVGYCRYLRGESQHFGWICEGEVIAVLCAEDFFWRENRECREMRGFFEELDAEEERRGPVAVQNAGASWDGHGGIRVRFGCVAEKFRLTVQCKKSAVHAGSEGANRRMQSAK